MKVLFLCTGNSARSQMAEGLLRSMAPKDWQVSSAGTKPVGLNPNAVDVMKEAGIDISSHRSKTIADAPPAPEVVITVCDNAARDCPVFPGKVERLHWPLPDPAAAHGTPEQIRQIFRNTRDDLRERLEQFLKSRGQR